MNPQPGTQLGPYRIEAVLGKGGMGEVFRARDTRLNRPVAIKFLSDDLADASARRRFQQEATMASALNHPHILTVHEAGETDGRQYLVTEFIDGGTLKDWARAETRTWKQVVDLLTGVADGLAAAHSAGMLHRDVKPANILVAKNGYAKLADFGLAKLEEQGAPAVETRTVMTQTRAGVVTGTVAYMSPEQAEGKVLDARSDIFSFGVVLYELLAGQRPFGGATDLALLQTIIHGSAQPLSDGTPLPLRMVVEKALEKDPAERYQSMRDLVVDLRRLARHKVADATLTAARPKALARWLPWVAMAVVAAGAGLWVARRPALTVENPLVNATFTKVADFEGAVSDAAISNDGKFVAFLSDQSGRFDVWMSQIGTGRIVNLTEHQEETPRLPVRNVGFSADGSEIWLRGGVVGDPSRLRLLPLTGGVPRAFLGEKAVNLAWSADGTRLVYHTREDGDPLLVAERTGANARQIHVDRPDVHNHFPIWSPDGQWIYFVHGIVAASDMDLWRIPASGGMPERLTEHHNDVRYPAPIDRNMLLYVTPDQDGSGPWLWALDVDRKTTRRVNVGLEKYTSVAATADGRRLAATVSNPTASLWSVPILDRPVEEREVTSFPVGTARALAPRFGGSSLFYLSSRGAGDGLWRYQDGRAVEIWKGADGALLEPPAISSDGRRVAVVLRQNEKRHLNVATADGSDLRPVADSIDVRGAAGWSPDGKWIVTGGSDAKGPALFKIPVEGGAPVRVMPGTAIDPVWSPDGTLIVYAGANVGAVAPLLAVGPDGARVELPAIQVFRGGERCRFLPTGQGLIYMQGLRPAQDFWLLDLITKKSRPLTRLNGSAGMRTFDISPDGTQIVFDRLRENATIVLIDLPREARSP